MPEGPRYRPERVVAGIPWTLIAVLMLVSAGLLLRAFWPMPTSVPVLVTVLGDVPRPGTYPLERGTVQEAIRAAGGEPTSVQDAFVPHGHRVEVRSGKGRILPPTDRLLVALPVDPNTATEAQLAALPGVGARLARKIVARRTSHGRYRNRAALRKVFGSRFEAAEPFIELSTVGRLDLNRADRAELEQLPGVGPVLAARIVADRDEHGRYTDLSQLQRVKGVGPVLLLSLEPLVMVR